MGYIPLQRHGLGDGTLDPCAPEMGLIAPLGGAPEEIRTPDLQIRSLVQCTSRRWPVNIEDRPARKNPARRTASSFASRVMASLLLHGVMAAGAMFDPLVNVLSDRFRMLIPDLRGHGRSGDLGGPYDVQALASDLDVVMAAAGFDRCAVMGYSHGGAVAQQLARTRPAHSE